MASWYQDQISNKNYLSPIGFVFVLDKARNVSFLCQRASIPDVSLGEIDIATPGFASYAIDGNIKYGELTLEFIVDEDLTNYLEVHNWIRALGTPSDRGERADWQRKFRNYEDSDPKFSDATLQVLNNNNRLNFNIVFEELFPVSLSTLEFDVTETDNDYFTAQATFAYSIYEIRNKKNERMA